MRPFPLMVVVYDKIKLKRWYLDMWSKTKIYISAENYIIKRLSYLTHFFTVPKKLQFLKTLYPNFPAWRRLICSVNRYRNRGSQREFSVDCVHTGRRYFAQPSYVDYGIKPKPRMRKPSTNWMAAAMKTKELLCFLIFNFFNTIWFTERVYMRIVVSCELVYFLNNFSHTPKHIRCQTSQINRINFEIVK